MNLATIITNTNFETQMFLLKKYSHHIKFIELRIDTFYPEKETIKNVLNKIKSLNKKIVLTFRSFSEGGKLKISETKILSFVIEILSQNKQEIDFLDIEINSKIKPQLVQLAKKFNKKIIFSTHFLSSNEQDNLKKLNKLLPKIKNFSKNNYVKIVAKIDNFKNYWEILKLVFGKNITFFTVGKTSLISRLIATIIDMPIIFVSLNKPVIKSQPDIKTLISNLKKLGYV